MKNKKQYWIGFDLGGTKMAATVFAGIDFSSCAGAKKKTRAFEGVRPTLTRIFELCQEVCAGAGIGTTDVCGIGCGCPGTVQTEKGIVLDAPNINWYNIDLKKELEKALGIPAVILNDVDAGTYGEYRFGAGMKKNRVVGVFPGTGIGGGCVLNGDLLMGTNISCFEIGHIQVQPDGPLCGCGQRGCVEALANRLAIATAAAAAAFRGEAPALLKNSGMDITSIKSSEIAYSIENGDRVVEQIVRTSCRWLGIAIASVVNLLAPDIIILGGGLVEAMPKLYTEEVQRTVDEKVYPSFRKTYTITTAMLGDNATAQGAAAWAQRLLDTETEPDA
jgi:glucokinase